MDRALADAKIGGDVLAWIASQDQVEDLPLTCGQAGDAYRLRLPRCRRWCGVLRLIDCPREADKQLHAVDRQFDNNIGMGSDSLRSTLLTEEACESLDQD